MNSGKFSIKSEYSAVTGLINRLRDNDFYSHVNERLRGEIEICLVEALNNVVRHSFKEESSHEIDVELNYVNGILEIKIVEDGFPRPAMDSPELEFDPDDIDNIPEGGMGLFIIDQLMDETSYNSENGINTLIMKKSIN